MASAKGAARGRASPGGGSLHKAHAHQAAEAALSWFSGASASRGCPEGLRKPTAAPTSGGGHPGSRCCTGEEPGAWEDESEGQSSGSEGERATRPDTAHPASAHVLWESSRKPPSLSFPIGKLSKMHCDRRRDGPRRPRSSARCRLAPSRRSASAIADEDRGCRRPRRRRPFLTEPAADGNAEGKSTSPVRWLISCR